MQNNDATTPTPNTVLAEWAKVSEAVVECTTGKTCYRVYFVDAEGNPNFFTTPSLLPAYSDVLLKITLIAMAHEYLPWLRYAASLQGTLGDIAQLWLITHGCHDEEETQKDMGSILDQAVRDTGGRFSVNPGLVQQILDDGTGGWD